VASGRGDRPGGGTTLTPGILVRFQAVTTCHISDALAQLGFAPFGLVGIAGLEPVKPFAGPAFTVQFKPKNGARPEERIEYLEMVQPGDVIVIENGGRTEASSWGGNRSLSAARRGAVAAVLHGSYRDVEELRRSGFPVYGVGPTVAASKHAALPVAVNVPIAITGCRIAPGDLVIGDASGVIVVPRASMDDVLAEAERIAARERTQATSAGPP
jgi:4-hydroxy-4-methyl-2-oxoglutarate aldolase